VPMPLWCSPANAVVSCPGKVCWAGLGWAAQGWCVPWLVDAAILVPCSTPGLPSHLSLRRECQPPTTKPVQMTTTCSVFSHLHLLAAPALAPWMSATQACGSSPCGMCRTRRARLSPQWIPWCGASARSAPRAILYPSFMWSALVLPSVLPSVSEIELQHATKNPRCYRPLLPHQPLWS
jgi:hypothetical protein